MPSSTLPKTKVFITNQCCKRPKLSNQYFKGPKYIKSRLQRAKIIKSIIQLTKIINQCYKRPKTSTLQRKRLSSRRKECCRSAANMYGCSLSTFCREAHCIMFEFMRLTADPRRHNFLEFNFFLLFIKRGSFSDILSVLTHNQLCCL